MLNFTLTITAAPELLEAMSGFIDAFTCAKVVAIPETNSDFPAARASREQIAAAFPYVQPITQNYVCPPQNTTLQQNVPTHPQLQTQSPEGVVSMTNQQNSAQVKHVNNQPVSNPVYSIQAQQQMIAQPQPTPVQGSAVPTAPQTYTMEQLAIAATQIVDTGRRTELVELLSSFGVQALTALPKEHYGAFATQLRALGAKI